MAEQRDILEHHREKRPIEATEDIYNLEIYENGYAYWSKDEHGKWKHFACLDNVLFINGEKAFSRPKGSR